MSMWSRSQMPPPRTRVRGHLVDRPSYEAQGLQVWFCGPSVSAGSGVVGQEPLTPARSSTLASAKIGTRARSASAMASLGRESTSTWRESVLMTTLA